MNAHPTDLKLALRRIETAVLSGEVDPAMALIAAGVHEIAWNCGPAAAEEILQDFIDRVRRGQYPKAPAPSDADRRHVPD